MILLALANNPTFNFFLNLFAFKQNIVLSQEIHFESSFIEFLFPF